MQDYPGRLGYWDVGVPPSGPMDGLSFRLANRARRQSRRRGGARNDDVRADAASSTRAAIICLTGARMRGRSSTATPVPFGRADPGAARRRRCASGAARGAGCRALSRGARRHSTCRRYLGSRATFTLGQVRRPRRPRACARAMCCTSAATRRLRPTPQAIPARRRSAASDADWEIGVLYGPHGAPRFLHRGGHRRRSSARPGRCTTTPAAPACG